MPTILAIVIAVASVLLAGSFALWKPDWLRRSSNRWAYTLVALSVLCFQQVFFWAQATVGDLADQLQYAPDSSLRSVHKVIGWAVDARHTYYPPFLILLGAAACVWAIRALRDLPPATAARHSEEPADAD